MKNKKTCAVKTENYKLKTNIQKMKMKIKIKINLFIILFVCTLFVKAQNCQHYPTSYVLLSTEQNVNFTFDSFAKYLGGITISGATMLRIKVDSIIDNPNCMWKLKIELDNNHVKGTPDKEWEQIENYGTAGNMPTLDMLQIRVRNGCNTSSLNLFASRFINYDDIVYIIDGNSLNYGPCSLNVNSVGSYLTNYEAYTFIIDYRIKPGYSYRPGLYQISLNFVLMEDN